MTTLAELGEREIIEQFRRLLPADSSVIVGPGDDCAIVRPATDNNFEWALTSDAVIENTHFTAETDAVGIGHKLAARCLSDLAAAGAEPMWALINISAPPSMDADRLKAVYRATADTAAKYGLSIVGGDTSSSNALALHMFAVGRLPRGSAMLRSGASPNDVVYVTGELGGSLAGRHLVFVPRVREGIWLRSQAWTSSAIDVSDGLECDLRNLIDVNRNGVRIELGSIPVSASARSCENGRSATEHALCDGEDYELLFTVPEEKADKFEKAWRSAFEVKVSRIGTVTGQAGSIDYVDTDGSIVNIRNKGYEHFRS
ncbi:MAG: thiamine-phosphate kinase [Lentisphaerales bacterium]|jgi:thiamine-monophosphate kinase|nr:MAG: thiamine-phosphate kinase [Lentisphaerales bacterium]